ncbi:hypothetical protein Zmor_020119 [Zophobas morio]|uniref:Uncharacterized protein n=1 Tax=Zophobas morio TaxID=2755281 RepID=A0AA38M9M4_9CUCU|nr:hypothetical protein Zmor_020119 [Zophobas morio]
MVAGIAYKLLSVFCVSLRLLYILANKSSIGFSTSRSPAQLLSDNWEDLELGYGRYGLLNKLIVAMDVHRLVLQMYGRKPTCSGKCIHIPSETHTDSCVVLFSRGSNNHTELI